MCTRPAAITIDFNIFPARAPSRQERRDPCTVTQTRAKDRVLTMLNARQAFERLREGNLRFVSNEAFRSLHTNPGRRADLVDGQEPFAVILGCSDSRVPAELVFDQGFGDLFVIRVAGNIVAPSQVGSVEFAASRFGTRLVVVMGHSQCGAIGATLEAMQ